MIIGLQGPAGAVGDRAGGARAVIVEDVVIPAGAGVGREGHAAQLHMGQEGLDKDLVVRFRAHGRRHLLRSLQYRLLPFYVGDGEEFPRIGALGGILIPCAAADNERAAQPRSPEQRRDAGRVRPELPRRQPDLGQDLCRGQFPGQRLQGFRFCGECQHRRLPFRGTDCKRPGEIGDHHLVQVADLPLDHL